MIFVDTNVFMYGVGKSHPLKAEARAFFTRSSTEGTVLITSSEVMQELLHAYIPANRQSALESAMRLVQGVCSDVWSLEKEDVLLARSLAAQHPELGARDLCHLACCRRRGVETIKTFDRRLSLVAGRFL